MPYYASTFLKLDKKLSKKEKEKINLQSAKPFFFKNDLCRLNYLGKIMNSPFLIIAKQIFETKSMTISYFTTFIFSIKTFLLIFFVY